MRLSEGTIEELEALIEEAKEEAERKRAEEEDRIVVRCAAHPGRKLVVDLHHFGGLADAQIAVLDEQNNIVFKVSPRGAELRKIQKIIGMDRTLIND